MILIESKNNSELINPSCIIFIKQVENKVFIRYKDESLSDSVHEFETKEKAKKAIELTYNKLRY